MSSDAAFRSALQPWLQILLRGREEQLLGARPDPALAARIDELAKRSSEGELTAGEQDEYEGCVRANKFLAILRRQAAKLADK